MKRLIPFLILFFAVGCKKNVSTPPIEKGLLKNQAITVGGLIRNYHIHVPNNPVNAPVVLLFHGNGSNYDEILGLTGIKAPYKKWLDIAQQENLILVVPNGSSGSTGSSGWNDCRNDAATNPTVDDMQFVISLLNHIKTKYNSNAAKVFALGTSNGGHFAIRLAQEIPDRITAFAAIVAANAVNSKCSNATTKVSALFMNGTSDPVIPYNGGSMTFNRGEVFSTDSTVSYWAKRNQTDILPEITMMPDINTNDNSTVTKSLYKNGSNGTEVALYKVTNGGHTEPSVAERYSALFLLAVGKQNGDIEMANEIWNFFKNKTK